MSKWVRAMKSEAKTLRAKNDYLKRYIEDIISQRSVSATWGSMFARYVTEMVPDHLQALPLTVENKLKR